MTALFAAIALAQSTDAQAPDARIPSLTGIIRRHPDFPSAILGNRRELAIYLPADYESSPRRRYPVLYMHDGQNLFDGATSFIPNQEWRADETAQALIQARLLRPIIIVGIANTGASRMDEYTPTRTAKYGGGRLADYGRFLTEEVMPFIDARYRTLRGPANTGLAGSSLGGLATLSMGLRYPNRFGRLGVVSPSIWWDNREILREVAAYQGRQRARIWIDMGNPESNDAVTDAAQLTAALTAKGWREGRDLTQFIEPGAGHNEAAWSRRFGLMLQYLWR